MNAKKFNVKVPGEAPVERLVKDVTKLAVATEEKKTVPAPAVNQEKAKKTRQKKTAPSVSMILQARAEKELKSVAVNLRVKGSVKERFDLLCKKLGYSQSDFFEVLVDLAEETIKQQEEK